MGKSRAAGEEEAIVKEKRPSDEPGRLSVLFCVSE